MIDKVRDRNPKDRLPAWWNVPKQMIWEWRQESVFSGPAWQFFLTLGGMALFIALMLLFGLADDWVY